MLLIVACFLSVCVYRGGEEVVDRGGGGRVWVSVDVFIIV